MVLALEALAELVDVQLRAVLRVAAVKVLKEPLRLLVDFFCAARGALASAACWFDGRIHTKKLTRSIFTFQILLFHRDGKTSPKTTAPTGSTPSSRRSTPTTRPSSMLPSPCMRPSSAPP